MADLDEALERFQQSALEYADGVANAGPMAAEALCALGHEALIPGLVDVYAPRLPALEIGEVIPDAEHGAALGDVARLPDWVATFDHQIRERPWRELLASWIPTLLPGLFAGAGAGWLRVAHAVRALSQTETEVRIRELGLGLALWAGRYQEPQLLPLRVEIVRETARSYLALPAERIAFADGFAVTSGVRLLAKQLPAGSVQRAVAHASQTALALRALQAASPELHASPEPDVETAQLAENHAEIRYRAACSLEEHAILFAEACLREDAIRPDRVLRLAAADAALRLVGVNPLHGR